jgi:hypothetical protein
MPRDKHVKHLMDKLLRAIEASLAASDAAREAVGEILCRSAGTGGDGAQKDALTDLDREFLRSISIRLENR